MKFTLFIPNKYDKKNLCLFIISITPLGFLTCLYHRFTENMFKLMAAYNGVANGNEIKLFVQFNEFI